MSFGSLPLFVHRHGSFFRYKANLGLIGLICQTISVPILQGLYPRIRFIKSAQLAAERSPKQGEWFHSNLI